MKKKNFLWSMFAIMMVAMLGVGLSACGDDDNNGGGKGNGDIDDDIPAGSNNGIVGSWTGVDGRETLTLTFKSDKTGTYVLKYEDPYSGTETERGTFTYTPESNTKGIILMKTYDSYSGETTDVFYYVIEGNRMSLYEHDYYDDLEWELTKDGSSSTDDNNATNGSTSASNVVGTWTGVDGRETLSLTFNSNNTGNYVLKYDDSYSGTDYEAGTFTYTPESSSKGIILIKTNDSYSGSSTDVFYYMIEGDKMYLYEQGYNNDLEWVLTKQ